MAILRFQALDVVNRRERVEVKYPSGKVSDYFGNHVFGLEEMQKILSATDFKKVESIIKEGKKIDIQTADAVAAGVKLWAMNKGANYYTHWFQPLTGSTAEKHDSFFDSLKNIEIFRGSALVQQEPDASSFPSGGMRSTFEARGYSAWDPSSHMFLIENTLCIPTIFVSYTGETLDYKTPLLKTIDVLDKVATKVCHLFDSSINRVFSTLGWEQEYFVIDRALYNARPDLMMTGRTVFGHHPARGQQLDDHYFGTISSRVLDFMKEFEIECHILGIPVKTRHNEVAPSQFEVAPMFEEMNLAVDHNQLLRDIMEKVALKHNLKVLFHEKPFAGVNGSGKHNNWSLSTDTGTNLLQPTNSARENLMFLTFFINVIKAVHEHSDLLRASIASYQNDFRLGANEAPPAIISIFIGQTLSKILDELETKGDIHIEKGENMYMKLGIDKIPEIILDNTDRNRTSPFAFTGNKFEFRAVGADANVSNPMMILNLIVADQLHSFYQTIEEKGELLEKEKRIAIIQVLREYIKSSKNIRFEGDGYSEEWKQEAKKRCLSNIKDTPQSLDFYITPKSIALFSKNNILSQREIQARHEIMLENYIKKAQIEARVIADICLNHIIPTAIAYHNTIITNALGIQELGINNTDMKQFVADISQQINFIRQQVQNMIQERKKVDALENHRDKAIAYCEHIKNKYFSAIRTSVDTLELVIDDEKWPLVKYRELLFLK